MNLEVLKQGSTFYKNTCIFFMVFRNLEVSILTVDEKTWVPLKALVELHANEILELT